MNAVIGVLTVSVVAYICYLHWRLKNAESKLGAITQADVDKDIVSSTHALSDAALDSALTKDLSGKPTSKP